MPETKRQGLHPGLKAAIVLLGVLAGLLLYYLDASGYFVRWKRLPDSPGFPTQLILVALRPIQIRANDGAVYELSRDQWVPAEEAKPLYEGMPTPHPCTSTAAPLQASAHPPKDISECLEIQYPQMETNTHIALAVDNNGSLFEWRVDKYGYDYSYVAKCLLFPVIGGLLAYGLLLLIPLLARLWTK